MSAGALWLRPLTRAKAELVSRLRDVPQEATASTGVKPSPVAVKAPGLSQARGCSFSRRSRRRLWLCYAMGLVAVPTHAAEGAPGNDSAPGPARYRVDFSAGKMVADGKSEHIELYDDVSVTVDRYRLTSEKLTLRRGPYGVTVEGEGCVAFCPCENAPVTLGFGAATVAPPTDLWIEDPTVRVGGIPVLWLPYLWLRSPDRLGLLPPRLAWRASDGLLAGAGVHIPWGTRRAANTRPSSLDLMASGYTKGGAELALRVGTPSSSTRVRWDHLGSSLVEMDSRGASSLGSTTGAWSVTALRGQRARTRTLELEPAAMRYDRAELSALRLSSNEVVGIGLRGIAPRAGPLDEFGLVGPVAFASAGAALGDFGASDAHVEAWTGSARGDGASTSVHQGAGLRLDGRPGPLAGNVYARERSLAVVTSRTNGAAVAVGAGSEVSLPLVRPYGDARAPAWHWVEPFARADGALGYSVGDVSIPLVSGTRWASALVGIRNAVEWDRTRSAAQLTLTAGWLGLAQRQSPAAVARIGASGESVATDVTVAGLPDDRSLIGVSRVRLGFPADVVVDARVEGRQGTQASTLRWLDRDVWDAPWNGWYHLPGWSAGGGLRVPWTLWLASVVSVDYDLTADRWLGERAGLAYRHPCGCLALVGQAGHRLGRRGLDASVTLDLMP